MADLIKVLDKEVFKTTLGTEADEVIIGDENSVMFKPRVAFTKWNKENKLSIVVPDGLIPNAITLLSGKELVHKNHNTGFYFERADEDIFKFGLILYNKPATNTWSFKLEGWEELDFFYQPPLTQKEIDNGFYRPDDVVGSYAVYHKTKVDFVKGQTNYQAGKFCHIYRPKVFDADGKFVGWVDLLIENGIYTLTVGQQIIDTAKYPLKFNDVLGVSTVGASASGSTQLYCTAFTFPAVSGTATYFKAAVSDAGGDSYIKMAAFIGSTTQTTNMVENSYTGVLAVTRTAKPTQDSEWTAGAITASFSPSTLYWLCQVTSDDTVQIWYDTGTYTVYSDVDAVYANFPVDPAETITSLGSYKFSTYILYDPGPYAAISGTAVPTCTEAEVVAGGETIIITLSLDTWVADGATFEAQRQNILNGLDASTSPTNGWNNEVRDKMGVGTVVRTSATIVTITLTAAAAYNITELETITVTVPATATVSGNPYTAVGTVIVTTVVTSALMSTTGEVYPTSATGSAIGAWADDAWVRTAAVLTAGAGTADAACISASTFDSGDQTHILKVLKFDFSGILEGSQIDGVIMRCEGWANTSGATATSCGLDFAKLLDTNASAVGDNQISAAGTTIFLSGTTQVISIGNSANTWGNTLTSAWVHHANFGVALGFIAKTANTDLWLDYVTLEIVYEPPTAAPTTPLSPMYQFIEC